MPRLQPARRGQHLLGLALEREQPARDLEQGAPELRRFDAPAATLEEAHAVARLQPLHLARQRRLRDVERRGGARESALAGHGMEGTQLRMIYSQYRYTP